MKIKNNEIPEELKKYAHNDERTVDELTNYVQRVIDETTTAIGYIADVITVIQQHRDSPIVQNNVVFDTDYGPYTYLELEQYLMVNYQKAQDMWAKAESVLQQLADIENTDDGILDEQLFNDVMKAITDLEKRYQLWEQ